MAIIDMIPPEYWRQLRQELNALDWDRIDSEAEAARQQAEQAERERLEQEYDEAVRRAHRRKEAESRSENERRTGYYRKWVAANREKVNAYARERYARLKAEKQAR